jgi:hypothetical protein
MISKKLLKERHQPPDRLILKPRQRGTKKLMEQYGDRFVCLRYGINEKRKKRLKTVEIIVDENKLKTDNRIPSNKIIHLRIQYGEIETARAVKGAGGRWNKAGKYRRLPYWEVRAIGLEDRIIK